MSDELEPIQPHEAANELHRRMNAARPAALPLQGPPPSISPLQRGMAAASVMLAVITAYLTLSVFLRDNTSDPNWLSSYLWKFAPLAVVTFALGFIGRATAYGVAGMALAGVTLIAVVLGQVMPGGSQMASHSPDTAHRITGDAQAAKPQLPAETPVEPKTNPAPAEVQTPAVAVTVKTPEPAPVVTEKKPEKSEAQPVTTVPPAAPLPITKADVEAAITKSVGAVKPIPEDDQLQSADWQAEAKMSLMRAQNIVRAKERALAEAEAALAEATAQIATQEKLIIAAKENLARLQRTKPVNADVLRKRFEAHLKDAQTELAEGKRSQGVARTSIEKARGELRTAQTAMAAPQRAYDAILRDKPPQFEPPARVKEKRTVFKLRDGRTVEAAKVVDFGTTYSIKDARGKFVAVEKEDVTEKTEIEVEVDAPANPPPVKPPVKKP